MGARQSKRSVDITTTPKKGEGELAVVGEGKLEQLGDIDVKVVTNGGAVHNDIEFVDKDEEVKETEQIKENGLPESEPEKSPEEEVPAAGDQANESTVSVEKSTEGVAEKIEETPDKKKEKEKEKKKKKWSLRSISFSKKDKSKPSKEGEKNGDVKDVTEEKPEEIAGNITEESIKTDDSKISSEPSSPVTNGDASKDELEEKSVEETPKPVEVKSPEATLEPVTETPVEPVPTPKEDVKPVEESIPKAEEPKAEEPKVVETPSLTEETKEVRSEEIPPPLPSSNPPSPVMVFAESTKADVLSIDPISVVENAPEITPVVDPPNQTVSETNVSEPTDSVHVPLSEKSLETNVSEPIKSAPLPVSEKSPESPQSIKPPTELIPPPVESPAEHIAESLPPVEPPSDTIDHLNQLVPQGEPISTKGEVVPSESPALELLNTKFINPDINTNIVVQTVITENVPTKVEENSPIPEAQPLEQISSTNASSILDAAEKPVETPAVDIPAPEPIKSSESSIMPNVDSDATIELSVESSVISEDDIKSEPEITANPVEEQILEIPPPSVSETAVVTNHLNKVPIDNLPVLATTDLKNVPTDSLHESVCNAESLPDLSTESLPSLPEPPSESLPEPLSLPPVECAPEPIVNDSLPESPALEQIPPPIFDSPIHKEQVLVNGNTNGLPSPPEAEFSNESLPALEGPIKQVPSEVTTDAHEISQSVGDTPAEDSTPAAAVEE